MRFHQLRHGARFAFRGTVYRKISPLKGEIEQDGIQKLVPRSAEVTLVDESGQAVSGELPERLHSQQLEVELTRFLADCSLAAQRLDPPLTQAQQTEFERAIDAAGADLRTRLALGNHGDSASRSP